jgi:hypothetical protein
MKRVDKIEALLNELVDLQESSPGEELILAGQ